MAVSLLLDPDTLQVDSYPGEDELEALLSSPTPTGVVFPDRELAEALMLVESIYDPEHHPRWPKGSKSPDGKSIAGEYMKVGERFSAGGHVWEISHVAGGHIIANDASGDLDKVETRVFNPTMLDGHNTIPGAVPAEIPKLHGGASYGNDSNVPIVKSGVVHDHDPSIALPKGVGTLDEEDWKQFGRVDQLLYVALAKRWGKWSPGFAAKVTPKLAAEYSTEARSAVTSAFSSQYSSGYSTAAGDMLSLVKLFGSHDLTKARSIYREAREMMGDLREANAWELYNRVRAPDVSTVHWGDGGPHNDKLVAGTGALKAGYSTSWAAGSWSGNQGTSMAVAVRNVLLATDVGGFAKSHAGEHEFTFGDRMKLSPDDAHTFKHASMNSNVLDWFNKTFSAGGSFRAGSVIKSMHDHMKGKGTLDLPPEPANLSYSKADIQLFKIPPPDVLAKAAEIAKTSGYAHGDTAEEALKPVNTMGLKPGDLIEGHTVGKRYLVIADPAQPLGIRYMKLDGSHGTFTFSSNSDRRKLEAHVEIPPEPESEETKNKFNSEAWSIAGAPQTLGTMNEGDKVTINGDYFTVTGQTGGQTKLKSLVNGNPAAAGSGFKTGTLGLKPGWTAAEAGIPDDDPAAIAAQPTYMPKIGDEVVADVFGQKQLGRIVGHAENGAVQFQGANGITSDLDPTHIEPAPSIHPTEIKKGDTFAFDGARMTVTTVLKDGTVKAKGGPGSAFSNVISFIPDSPVLKGAFRPSDYAVADKAKLKTLAVGAIFSGSGAKVRPYQVLSHHGNMISVRNLDTGETSLLSGSKGYSLLKTAETLEAEKPSDPSVVDATGVDHSMLSVGDKVNADQLQPGDQFKVTGADSVYTFHGLSTVDGLTKAKITSPTSAMPFAVSLGTLGGVFYQGHAAPDAEPTPEPTQVDPHDLPDAAEHGFVPFKSNAGPGNAYKHDKLKTLITGELFADKNGKAWKVKQGGETPVITDGEKLFKVNGNLRVKRAEHAKAGVFLHDASPDMSGNAPASTPEPVSVDPEPETPDTPSEPSVNADPPVEPAGESGPKTSTLSDLPPGTTYKATTNGNEVKILSKSGNLAHLQLMKKGPGAEGNIEVGHTWEAQISGGNPVIALSHEDVDDAGAETPALPITPYGSKYGSGGATTYPVIKDVMIGSHVQGKDGKQYIVMGHNVAGAHSGVTPATLPSDHTSLSAVDGSGKVQVPHTFDAGTGKMKATRVKVTQEPNEVQTATPAPTETTEDTSGWEDGHSQDVSSMQWEPGDKYLDQDGDINTVLQQNPDGMVQATYVHKNGEVSSPLWWNTSQKVLKFQKAGDAFKTPASDLEPELPATSNLAASPIPNYSDVKLTGGSAAGGSTGAQIMDGDDGNKWLKKTYGGNQDRIATELLSNRIYDALGVKVAAAGMQKDGGKVALAYPLEDGETTHFSTKYGAGDEAKRKALGRDYMADALVGNYDFVGLDDDNVLWNGDEPTRIDQGGTFEYRAQGAPKEFGAVPSDVWSMLQKGQGKRGVIVSEQSMKAQAKKIGDTLTDDKIDALVDAAPFKDSAMRTRLRARLKTRVQWMRDFADGKESLPSDVPLAKDEDLPAPTAVSAESPNVPVLQDHPFGAPGMKAATATSLPNFTVVSHHGAPWFKANNGMWYAMGSQDGKSWKDYKPNVMSVSSPLPGMVEPTGTTAPVQSIPVGGVFQTPDGKVHMMLGKGVDGIHALNIADHSISFGGRAVNPDVPTYQMKTAAPAEPEDTPAGITGTMWTKMTNPGNQAVGAQRPNYAPAHAAAKAFMESAAVEPSEQAQIHALATGLAGGGGSDSSSTWGVAYSKAFQATMGEKSPNLYYKVQADVNAFNQAQSQPSMAASTPSIAASTPSDLPIKPYGSKWASGGAFTYPKIEEVPIGKVFTDKGGVKHMVIGHASASGHSNGKSGGAPPGHTNATNLITGETYLIPHTFTAANGTVKPTRVKLYET